MIQIKTLIYEKYLKVGAGEVFPPRMSIKVGGKLLTRRNLVDDPSPTRTSSRDPVMSIGNAP